MPVLDFVFIGPGRSGTTFIDSVLRQDSRIALPKNIKETNFFLASGRNSERNFWSEFDQDCIEVDRRGEVANMYVYNPKSAEYLHSMGDQLTLHTILRNPFERLQSSLRYRIASGEIAKFTTFSDVLEKYPDLIEQSSYYSLLKPYTELFGDRLNVYFFEDLKSRPLELFEGFYRNIQLAMPEEISLKDSNQNVVFRPRSGVFVGIGRIVADLLRKLGLYRLLGLLKRNSLVKVLLYSNKHVQVEMEDWPKEIVMKINAEIDQLSKVIDRDVSHWKKSID